MKVNKDRAAAISDFTNCGLKSPVDATDFDDMRIDDRRFGEIAGVWRR